MQATQTFFHDNAESPRPLHREMPPATPFPVEALGSILGGATEAITDKIQCPMAVSGLAVLGAASLVTQAYADVVIPATGHTKPTSLFLISVAASGERKSAADEEALRPIREWEKNAARQHAAAMPAHQNKHQAWLAARGKAKKGKLKSPDAIAEALDSIGSEPQPPLTPMLTCPEPTFERLCHLYKHGYPALGLFSDEGGQFIGGHSMKEDNRLRMAGGLCALWDGSPIKRVRVDDGSYVLSGRRLALHLMMQPDVASLLLSDAMLKDQGLLSRLLVSFPETKMGTRFQRIVSMQSQQALQRYNQRLSHILNMHLPLVEDKTNELEPRKLPLDEEASALWIQYANHVEACSARDGKYETICGLANKLPEHALRIAGVITLIEDINAASINVATLNNAILLAEYFAEEALRLFDSGSVSAEIRDAERLRIWLQTKWQTPIIDLRTIYQKGPSSIRNAKAAKRAVHILEEHGWLHRLEPGTVIEGRAVKDAWQIISAANLATNATGACSTLANVAAPPTGEEK